MAIDKFKRPDNRGRPAWVIALWFFVNGTIFRMSGYPLNGWRCFLLRLFGAKVGRNVVIRPSAKFHFPWKVEIGDNCTIGDETWFYSLGNIKVGRNTSIAQRVFICAGSHDYTKETFDLITEPIIIGESAWIGASVFIHPGVTIGSYSVIGAMSNVTGNISAHMVAFGNPCKEKKKRVESP